MKKVLAISSLILLAGLFLHACGLIPNSNTSFVTITIGDGQWGTLHAEKVTTWSRFKYFLAGGAGVAESAPARLRRGASGGHRMDWVAVSATNDKYEPQAREYLTGLVQLANIPTSPIHLTVDYDVTDPVPGVRYQRVANSSFKAPSPIYCLQHGEFLQTVRAPIVLFTDCDIAVQRPFTTEKCDRIAGIRPHEVWCSYNNGEGDSLLHEAIRLTPLASLGDHPQQDAQVHHAPDVCAHLQHGRRKDAAEIPRLLAEGNLEAVRTSGHSMAGSAGGYGFPEIGAMGKDIEAAAVAARLQEITDICSRLSDYLTTVTVIFTGKQG